MPRPPMMVQNPLMGGYRSGGFRGLMGNPLFHAGIGLLSQGPSLVPQSPLQGLGAGLQSYAAAQQMLSQQDLDRQRLEMEREKLEATQAGRQRGYLEDAEKRRARIQLGIDAGMSPEQAERLASAGMLGGQLEQQMAPPDVPSAVETAQWLADPNTPQSEKDAFFASRRAGAQNINIGAQGFEPQTTEGKLLFDLSELQKLPQSAERDSAIEAIQGKLRTAEEARRGTEGAVREEKARIFAERVDAAQAEYDAAVEALQADPFNPARRRAVSNAQHALRASLGQDVNIEGEPSDFITRGFDVPGPTRAVLEPIVSRAFRTLRRRLGGEAAPEAAPEAPQLSIDDLVNQYAD